MMTMNHGARSRSRLIGPRARQSSADVRMPSSYDQELRLTPMQTESLALSQIKHGRRLCLLISPGLKVKYRQDKYSIAPLYGNRGL